MSKRNDTEFKLNAIQLVLEQGLKVSQVSHDLGIGLSTLQRWIHEFKTNGGKNFLNFNKTTPEQERLRKLERENEILRRERDILKKALAIFSLP